MNKLDYFFLKNLSYCAALKHRTPLDTVYCNVSSNRDQIIEEYSNILQSRDSTRLIYLFIVDKITKDDLEQILVNFSFNDFFPYFESCNKSILDDNLSLDYMFQFINFFHLIGSLRILRDHEKFRDQINTILMKIMSSEDYPFLIQYSASQIYVSSDLGNSDLVENETLKEFFTNLINYIEKDSFFTHFIGLYSMYYNSFAIKTNIINQLYTKIFADSKIDVNHLFTYLPQLHCMLRRLYKDTFLNKINENNKFLNLYYTKEYDVTLVRKSFEGIESLL